jgi:hypothetical protein
VEKISEILTNTSSNTISVSVRTRNLNTNTKTLKRSVTDVRSIALSIAEKLNNPTRFKLYCKYVWHLPDNIIWNNLELALAGKNPQRLFSWLCEESMKK